MSNEIFSVATLFPDVASLAQGYMNRADGERMLLPLPVSSRAGTGVRFVVYLADGTPAFAGAGLCVQVSDQGGTVPVAQRFETLLDTLQFDERSRPVYDYIVAVRNAAYAQHQASAGDATLEVEGEGLHSVPAGAYADEPTAIVDVEALQPVADSGAPAEAYAGDGYASTSEHPVSLAPVSQTAPTPVPEPAPAAWIPPPELQPMPSFLPPPLPTGLLTRPARTTHWQPAHPRRPTPRPASGMFNYRSGGLPRPARPPRPDLDPSVWVSPAPRPG